MKTSTGLLILRLLEYLEHGDEYMREDDIGYDEDREDISNMDTDSLRFELDLLYDNVNSTYLHSIIRRIVDIELELERRSNQ